MLILCVSVVFMCVVCVRRRPKGGVGCLSLHSEASLFKSGSLVSVELVPFGLGYAMVKARAGRTQLLHGCWNLNS